jgi:hypothetical protein
MYERMILIRTLDLNSAPKLLLVTPKRHTPADVTSLADFST